MTLIHTQQGMRRLHMVQVRAAIKLYAQTGIIPTRGCTITKLLSMASEYTGQRYGKGREEHLRAIGDMDKAIAEAT